MLKGKTHFPLPFGIIVPDLGRNFQPIPPLIFQHLSSTHAASKLACCQLKPFAHFAGVFIVELLSSRKTWPRPAVQIVFGDWELSNFTRSLVTKTNRVE